MSTRRANVNIAKPNLVNRERRSPKRTKTPSSNELKNKYNFSPKGKRKLDFPFKGKKPGPLAGKLFYLDLNGFRYATQLKKAIEQLGGTIEEFFRKEVTYLVTSRGDCGKLASSQSVPSPGTPSPGTPSSMHLTRSSSVKKYTAASPMSTDSPQGMDTQSQVPNGTMRGKSIAQRSAGFRKGSTDIVINASTWGVNIVHVDDVINWISQLMSKAQLKQETSKQKTASPSKRVSQTKLPKVIALKETYIKVEDLCFKYRPIVHECKAWPNITFDGFNVCPFDPPRRRSSENSFAKGNGGKGSVKKPPMYERPKHGYCECCEVRYADLDMHLKGKQHKDFARKDLNYASLDKAINEGPKIEDLLREIDLKKPSNCPNISPAPEKNNLSASYEGSDDVKEDEVLLLSKPRRPQRNKKEILDSIPSSKEDFNNKEQEKTFVEENSCEYYDIVQNVYSLSKPFTPTTKLAIDAQEIECPNSGPVTRLQKASSNSSSPSASKHLLSSFKRENGDKTSSLWRNIKKRETKRKSAEVQKDCNNFDAVLDDTEDEHCLTKRTARKASENSKKSDEAEVQLSKDEDIRETESRNKLRHGEKNVKVSSMNVCTRLAWENSGEQCTKSNQSAYKANAFQYSTVTKNVESEPNCQSKSPKIADTTMDECNKTVILNERESGDDNGEGSLLKSPKNQKIIGRDNPRKNTRSANNKIGPNDSIEPNRNGAEQSKQKTECDIIISDLSGTEVDGQESPPLRTSAENFSNDNHFTVCPGALIEDENTGTVRSVRRRKSAISECTLSPILPCNVNGEYCVRSRSEDIEFLPLDLPIYSSFGSSLGVVSRDVNHLVDRIGEEFHTDDGNDLEVNADGDETLVNPARDTLSSYDEIVREHNFEPSTSPKTKDLFQQNIKGQIENTELQVSVTYINLDEIPSARGEDKEASGNVKRKRNEEEPMKAKKCKRLSDDSDSHLDDLIESRYTSESEAQDIYRSSVAERVKLQRAINQSLQECGLPSIVSVPSTSPQVQLKGRKRKNVLQSSPFAEITNTCKKKRERAKSEGRITTRIIRPNQNRKSQQPRSACLIPNDPFSFDDY